MSRLLTLITVLSLWSVAASAEPPSRDAIGPPSCDPDAGHRAREHVVSGVDARTAQAEWRRALDAGGAVAWTATLYDVDARSDFLAAFDRQAIRIYRMGQFVSPLETHLGVPEFPGPEQTEFWRALGGCISDSIVPEAVVPWSQVRELKAGNWVLWFKLTDRVTIASDRHKRHTLDEIKVNLHGGSGEVEYRWNWDPYRGVENFRGIGYGPAPYQERVRYTLVELFDPARRIRLPKQTRGAGW